MGANRVERGQFLGPDRLADAAFGDAIAVAYLLGVGHRRDVDLGRRRPGPLGEGATEHKLIAKGRHIGLFAHQLDIPGPVDDMAIEDAADDPVIAQDHLLVNAAPCIMQRDFLVGFVGRGERPGGEHVDASDLEAGEDGRRDIDRRVVAGEARAAHLGLLPNRGDEAENLAVMLDALANCVDARVAGAHIVADQEAAVDIEPSGARQVDIGADADRQHDEIGLNLAAISQQHTLGLVAAEDFLGLSVGEEGDAARVEIALQQFARCRVELTLH